MRRRFPLRISSLSTIVILVSLVGLSNSTNASPQTMTGIVPFDFITVDGEEENLGDYTDKPIILEWGASWCPICKQNQENVQAVHELYGDVVNFISLSYYGSEDTLDEIKTMQERGPYNWTFGIDHTNNASKYNTRNGYVWILDEDLELVRSWNYTIVPVSQLREGVESVLPVESLVTSDISENVQILPLDNPVFLIFLLLAVLGLGVVVVAQLRKQGD